MDDVAETDSFVKQGGYVRITLEMIRKSDIHAYAICTSGFGCGGSADTLGDDFNHLYPRLRALGPTLDQDTVALFNAAHNNLDNNGIQRCGLEGGTN